MQVVVVSRWYPSDRDPLSGVFVEDHVRALRSACDVRVLVPYPAGAADVLSGLRSRAPLADVEPLATPRSRLGLPLRLAAFERALSRLGQPRRGRVVVHVHLLVPDALAALAAARLHGWPCVVTEHVSFLDELLRTRRAAIQTRLVLRHADAVLPVSAALERELHALEPRVRTRRIANPLDLELFAPAERPARDFAVNVAIELGREKGTDVLLRAWAAARASAPLPPLVVVGDGPARPDAERLAADLGLEGVVRFVGLKTRAEVAGLLRNAAFLVSSSLRENVAGVVAEAIACGTPVVSTRTGEPAAYVTDAVGLLVEPGDVRGLAAAVGEMTRRHGEYDASRLHEHVRGLYGAEAVREQLLDLYEELLVRPGSIESAA